MLDVKGRRKRERKEGMAAALKAMAIARAVMMVVTRTLGESFSLTDW